MTNKAPFASVADAQSRFVSVGVDRIHYVTVGRGSRTFVFVHGWACNIGFWREQVPMLTDKARLVLIDLPGHGQSDKPETAYTMDFFARAVLAVLRDAGVGEAVFIGHSMGAAVLCRVYHHAPDKFAGLVSVDGLLCRLTETAGEARALADGFASPHYLAHAKGFITTFFPMPGTEVLRNCVMAEMLVTPQYVMLGAMRAMLDPDQPDWILQKVDAPIIVINARTLWWDDAYENYVRSLSSRTDYHMMDGVGHFLMLEKPIEFNATLASLLQKHGLIAE